MQGVLTSREAWARFACALLQGTEMEAEEIAAEADDMLVQYLLRFPDPPELESARVAADKTKRIRFSLRAPVVPQESAE